MRVTTNMIYNKGLASIQDQTAKLLHTQQQASTGRRILRPSDDPIASARALEVNNAKSVNTQFATNRGYAGDNLKLLESRLVGVGDVMHYVRTRAVQAGDGTLKSEDLNSIAADMRSQFDSLLALSNSQDGNGEYIFAGYMSQTKPFEGNIAGVSYAGDQGIRTVQASSSRYMSVSLPGSDVFENTRTVEGSLYGVKNANNKGTGALAVSYSSTPPAPSDMGRRYDIKYDAASSSYAVTEHQPGNPTAVPVAATLSGTTLSFNGLDVDVSGAPADGDSFEVFAASKNVFQNLAIFVDSLERPGASGMEGAVAFTLDSMDAGLENVLRVRSSVGSQLLEIDNLDSVGSDLDLQYESRLSQLQDVDYAKAISDLTLQSTYLQAAQQSFMKVSNLSLFNYLS